MLLWVAEFSHMSSWHSACLIKHRDNFTFLFLTFIPSEFEFSGFHIHLLQTQTQILN
jgi:hypothetical protein